MSSRTEPITTSRGRFNRILEDTAWGPYRTELYPTCGYKAAGMPDHDKATAN